MRKLILMAIAAFVWKKLQANRGTGLPITKQNGP